MGWLRPDYRGFLDIGESVTFGPQYLYFPETPDHFDGSPHNTTIFRADLDGGNLVYDWMKPQTGRITDVAVDANHIYWANTGRGTIGRADIDGTHQISDFIDTGDERVQNVALYANHIYWVSGCCVGRSKLDGTEVEPHLVERTIYGPKGGGLAVDSLGPPDTTIDSGPSGGTLDASPSFTFSSSKSWLELRVPPRLRGLRSVHLPY